MDLSMNEVMMLLGEKDLIIFQQNKQIAELQKLLAELKQIVGENPNGQLVKPN